MKLIIDIGDDTYKRVISDSKTYVLDEIFVENAIYNGTPLDDIKAEIETEKEKEKAEINYGKVYVYNKCLEIIDKHVGKEKE